MEFEKKILGGSMHLKKTDFKVVTESHTEDQVCKRFCIF